VRNTYFMKRIYLPLTKDVRVKLRAGDELLLCGKIYTARDAAHKRFDKALKENRPLPFDLRDNLIYYCGPTPASPDSKIGACGPTTSKRMDGFTPKLLKMGLAATIGKGRRSPEVIEAIKRYKALYLVAVGGAGAYLSKRIKEVNVMTYSDLGPEAVYEFLVEDFPVTVAIDANGKSIFK